MTEWKDGAPVLPVELGTHATAYAEHLFVSHTGRDMLGCRYRQVPWPLAARVLRYREAEPWCVDSYRDNGLVCDITTPAYHGESAYLHRLAAILCDDSEAFRVLHWCVHNLGGNHATQ